MKDLVAGQTMFCRSVSVYDGQLTYGRAYMLIETDIAKRQIRVQSDNGRTRWFPVSCFAGSESEVALIIQITLIDEIEPGATTAVEVEVTMSSGEMRWCYFVTPAILASSGDEIEGSNVRIHYGAPNMIVVGELTENLIHRALRQIERQGDILTVTRPITEIR